MADPVYKDSASLRLRRTGSVLEVIFNRPDTRNALTHGMMEEIAVVVDQVAEDRTIRVVVLRGSGGNFCAGGDLNAMRNLPAPPAPGETDPLVAPYRFFGDVLLRLNALPQAVVALVEGSAVGGGFGMVCCSDVVIVDSAATFAIPEVRWGFIPSQIIPLIVRRIGGARARHLAVTGTRLRGREAVAAGIGHFCTDTKQEMDQLGKQVIDQILKCEPGAVATVKKLMLAAEVEPIEQVLNRAAEGLVGLLRSPEGRAGMDAFLAKTPPAWVEESVAPADTAKEEA